MPSHGYNVTSVETLHSTNGTALTEDMLSEIATSGVDEIGSRRPSLSAASATDSKEKAKPPKAKPSTSKEGRARSLTPTKDTSQPQDAVPVRRREHPPSSEQRKPRPHPKGEHLVYFEYSNSLIGASSGRCKKRVRAGNEAANLHFGRQTGCAAGDATQSSSQAAARTFTAREEVGDSGAESDIANVDPDTENVAQNMILPESASDLSYEELLREDSSAALPAPPSELSTFVPPSIDPQYQKGVSDNNLNAVETTPLQWDNSRARKFQPLGSDMHVSLSQTNAMQRSINQEADSRSMPLGGASPKNSGPRLGLGRKSADQAKNLSKHSSSVVAPIAGGALRSARALRAAVQEGGQSNGQRVASARQRGNDGMDNVSKRSKDEGVPRPAVPDSAPRPPAFGSQGAQRSRPVGWSSSRTAARPANSARGVEKGSAFEGASAPSSLPKIDTKGSVETRQGSGGRGRFVRKFKV
jgi:hypothetical protein